MTDPQSSPPSLVRDLMSVGVFTCALNTPLVDLVRAFLERDLEAAVVLDENGHAAGVVSQSELVRAYTTGAYQDATAEQFMEPGICQVPPDIPLTAAAQLMLDRGLRAFFMTHRAGGIEYPAAVLTYRHFLRHMTMSDPSDLADLGIKASRKPPLETFFERRDAARKRNLPDNLHSEE